MSEPLGRLQAALAGVYLPERELGGGGMSHVFVAVDRALGRRVVVKVLHPELAATLSVERFRREVLLAAGLQHPNVVPVITAGEVEGLPYFVMPFVEGESLKDRLVRGPLSVREAVGVAKDVARALAFAHGRGIVHRDVKPGNVLLAGGAAMVTDFGVAKAIVSAHDSGAHRAGGRPRPPASAGATGRGPGRGAAALTAAGVSLGTPAYMAPEQAAADPAADHRADLYSLGVLLFEMLAGTPPFHGRTAQALLTAQLSEPPPPIATRRYDVPQPLADIIMGCLEKDPARRPRSAAELLRALEDPQTLSGAFATPPAARRRSRRLVLLGTVAAVGVLVLAGAWWGLSRTDEASGGGEARDAVGGRALPPGARGRAVVVMPLVAVGDDARARAIAEGLTSQLAGALARVPGLRVSPVPVAGPAGDTASAVAPVVAPIAAAIPPAAGALLVRGTVQREGEQLRVVLRVEDAVADSTLWSESFDRGADAVFALQDDATRALAAALAARTGAPPTP